MIAYVKKSAIVFMASIWGAANSAGLSSDFQSENLSRFCPESHGQIVVRECSDSVFTESENPAEDTGVEPATREGN